MIDEITVLQLAQAVAVAFALGTSILVILSLLPATGQAARQLWPLLGSEAVILSAGTLPWLLPQPVIMLCVLLAAGRIGFESGVVSGIMAKRRLSPQLAIAGVIASLTGWLSGGEVLGWILFTLLAAAIVMTLLAERYTLPWTLANFAVFPLAPILAFSHAAAQPLLAPVLVLAFLLVEIFDSFSLLGGRIHGRTPIFPRLSPRKTWEGFGTGAIFLFVTIIALALAYEMPTMLMLFTGVVVLCAAIAGDLLGSLSKRRAGVKDYPAILRVQGGLLDIMDSWLVAAPCLVLFAMWIS